MAKGKWDNSSRFFPKTSVWGERAEVGGEVGHVVPHGVVDLMESKDL